MEEECEPQYENELCIYEEETLQKINEFKNARSHWDTNKNITQTVYTNVKEGLDETDIYKGRCVCLRRIRLRTTFLINHFKKLKPLRYFTLKKKIAECRKFDSEYEGKSAEEIKTPLEETCSAREVWNRKEMEECFRDELKTLDKKTRKRKRKECKKKRSSGPCKKVMKKLKAEKYSGGLIESCKCEDGREVTVVIKGICLCDKGSFNSLNLNKVCDEYSRMANRASGGPLPLITAPEEQLNQNILDNNIEENKMTEPSKGTVLETQEGITKTETETKLEVDPRPEMKGTVLETQEGITKTETETKLEADTSPEIKKPQSQDDDAEELLDAMKPLHAVDSLNIYRKRRAARSEHLIVPDFDKSVLDETPEGTKKKTTFKEEDLKSEHKEKPNVSGISDITLFPRATVGSDKDMKFKGSDSLRNLLTDSTSDSNLRKTEKQSHDIQFKNQSEEKPESPVSDVTDGVGKLEAKAKDNNKSDVTEATKNFDSKNSKSELTRLSEFCKKNRNRNNSDKINDQKKEVDMPGSKSKRNVMCKKEKETASQDSNSKIKATPVKEKDVPDQDSKSKIKSTPKEEKEEPDQDSKSKIKATPKQQEEAPDKDSKIKCKPKEEKESPDQDSKSKIKATPLNQKEAPDKDSKSKIKSTPKEEKEAPDQDSKSKIKSTPKEEKEEPDQDSKSKIKATPKEEKEAPDQDSNSKIKATPKQEEEAPDKDSKIKRKPKEEKESPDQNSKSKIKATPLNQKEAPDKDSKSKIKATPKQKEEAADKDSKSKIKTTPKEKEQEKEAPIEKKQEKEIARRDNDASMITLYRNKSEEKSFTILTKEELGRLKIKKEENL